MAVERAALVTGASSGIGRAMVIALAEDGYAVTAAARRSDRLREIESAAGERGQTVRGVTTDLSREEDIVRLASEHRDAFGRLDVLINCAGHGKGGAPVAAQSTELMEQHWRTNTRAPMILARETFELLEAAGKDHGKALVVNVASVAAKLGPARMSAYAATKAAMRVFTDSLRSEFTGKGVQVVSFLPSFTASEMSAWLEQAGLPLSELIQPEDLVRAVRFLLSTTANCHVPEIEFSCPPATAFIASGALERAGGFGSAD